jgi:hypothetical protein
MAPNVAVDVSKERLDIGLYPEGSHFSVTNDAAGWRELCRRLRPIGARAIGAVRSLG